MYVHICMRPHSDHVAYDNCAYIPFVFHIGVFNPHVPPATTVPSNAAGKLCVFCVSPLCAKIIYLPT